MPRPPVYPGSGAFFIKILEEGLKRIANRQINYGCFSTSKQKKTSKQEQAKGTKFSSAWR